LNLAEVLLGGPFSQLTYQECDGLEGLARCHGDPAAANRGLHAARGLFERRNGTLRRPSARPAVLLVRNAAVTGIASGSCCHAPLLGKMDLSACSKRQLNRGDFAA
jgi:hypothetical protein